MNEKIIKQIKALPPLPKSVIEVQKITNDPNSSIADLVKVIKQDPMLTANLLKVANSPLYGFSRQIKTVDQAVSLFGMTTVKGFAISFAIRNSIKFNLSAYGIDENHFHDVSILRNSIGFNWYKRKRDKLEIISTDSFLIDLGAVVISLVLVGEGRADEFKNALTPENRYEVEKEFVGSTTPEITAEIFKHWNFSEDLVMPMEHIDNPLNAPKYKECASVFNVLRECVDLLTKLTEENEKKALSKVEEFGLDEDSFLDALSVVKGG
ncbi:MAG: HDOD domain-containing protein [Epsilonproteobacteria bacterium]|nr:HDOD domain-containing protein [Campylobacterota bacterium]